MRLGYSMVNFIVTFSYVLSESSGSVTYPRLIAIIDCSNSISLKSFNSVIHYLQNELECPAPREVCVVTFGTDATEAITCSADLPSVKNSLSSLQLYNGTHNNDQTDIASAINLSTKIIVNYPQPKNIVLLFSDAKANDPGRVKQAKFKAIAAASKLKAKVTDFYCVGMPNSNDKVLHKICDKSKVSYINDLEKPKLCPMPVTNMPTIKPTLSPTVSKYATLFVIIDYSSSIKAIDFSKILTYLSANIACAQPRQVCVLGFALQPQMLVKCTYDLNLVKSQIAAIKPRENSGNHPQTNIAGAISYTNKYLTGLSPETMVVLFSDGNANTPGSDANAKHAAIMASAQLRKEILQFSCVGVGNTDLQTITSMCGKSVYNIDSPTHANLCPKIKRF